MTLSIVENVPNLNDYLNQLLTYRCPKLIGFSNNCFLTNLFVLEDPENALFSINVHHIRFEKRVPYLQLIQSIVRQAEEIHILRSSHLQKHSLLPTSMTSVLLPSMLHLGPSEIMHELMTLSDWECLWRCIGGDLFRHLFLNTIIFKKLHHTKILNDWKILYQLSGSLFTDDTQSRLSYLKEKTSFNTDYPSLIIKPLLQLPMPHIQASHRPTHLNEEFSSPMTNPLLEKQRRKNSRRAKQNTSITTSFTHVTKDTYVSHSSSHSKVQTAHIVVSKKRIFHHPYFRRHLSLPKYFILNNITDPLRLFHYIMDPLHLSNELAHYLYNLLAPLFHDIFRRFKTFQCGVLFKKTCHIQTMRYRLRHYLRDPRNHVCTQYVYYTNNKRQRSTKIQQDHQFSTRCKQKNKEYVYINDMIDSTVSYQHLYHNNPHSQSDSPIKSFSTFDLCSPHHHVIHFILSIVRHLIPPKLLGGRFNFTKVCQSISTLITLNRGESLTLNLLLQNVSLRHMCDSWEIRLSFLMNPTFSIETIGQAHELLQSVLARLMLFLLNNIILPILKCYFYITTSEATQRRPLYFIKSLWGAIRSTCDKEFINASGLQRLSKQEIAELKVTTPHIAKWKPPRLKWIPKYHGCRPIINLSSESTGYVFQGQLYHKHPEYTMKGRTLQFKQFGNHSVNHFLIPIKTILSLLYKQQSDHFGGSVLGLQSVFNKYLKWHSSTLSSPIQNNNITTLNTGINQITLSPPYIISGDFHRCYDALNHSQLLKAVNYLHIPERMIIRRFYIRSLDSKKGRFEKLLSTKRDECISHIINALVSNTYDNDILNETISFQTMIIRASQMCQRSSYNYGTCRDPCRTIVITHVDNDNAYTADECYHSIQTHLETSVFVVESMKKQHRLSVQSGSLYRQTTGIIQGSCVSPLLCAAYYGAIDCLNWDQSITELYIRWVDDFLFISWDKQRCIKFLELLLDKKIWGSNIHWEKLHSNDASLNSLIVEKNKSFNQIQDSRSCQKRQFNGTQQLYMPSVVIKKSHMITDSSNNHTEVLWAGLCFVWESDSAHLRLMPAMPELSMLSTSVRDTAILVTAPRIKDHRTFIERSLDQRLLGFLRIKLGSPLFVNYVIHSLSEVQSYIFHSYCVNRVIWKIQSNLYILGQIIGRRLIVGVSRLKKKLRIVLTWNRLLYLLKRLCSTTTRLCFSAMIQHPSLCPVNSGIHEKAFRWSAAGSRGFYCGMINRLHRYQPFSKYF